MRSIPVLTSIDPPVGSLWAREAKGVEEAEEAEEVEKVVEEVSRVEEG